MSNSGEGNRDYDDEQRNSGDSYDRPVPFSDAAIDRVIARAGGRDGVAHNFVGDKMAIWRATAGVKGAGVLSRRDLPATPLPVTNIYIHTVEMSPDKGGEVATVLRTVLVAKDGKRYGFVSDGIAKDAAEILATFGNGSWPEPILLNVEEIETRNKFRMLTLSPA